MKKWSLIVGAAMLAGCGVVATPEQPYTVQMVDYGYSVKVDDKGVETYTVPQVKVQITSAKGAKDLYNLNFKAYLLKGDNSPALTDANGNASAEDFITGQMVGYMKGGYACTTTADTACAITSADAYFAPRTLNFADVAPTARMPIAWAVAHNHTAGSTSWHVRFDFTASSGGAPISWSESYQIVSPAGSN